MTDFQMLIRVLGVAKTQWYTQWIKTNALWADTPKKERELHFIHDFLESVSFCLEDNPTTDFTHSSSHLLGLGDCR